MSLRHDNLRILKGLGAFPALGSLLICGLLLIGVLLIAVPAHADDLQDAISTIGSLYAQYVNIFGAPFGPVQTGVDVTGTFYVQWYVNGTGIKAASDGFMYSYNGMWYSLKINWK